METQISKFTVKFLFTLYEWSLRKFSGKYKLLFMISSQIGFIWTSIYGRLVLSTFRVLQTIKVKLLLQTSFQLSLRSHPKTYFPTFIIIRFCLQTTSVCSVLRSNYKTIFHTPFTKIRRPTRYNQPTSGCCFGFVKHNTIQIYNKSNVM